MSIAFVSQNNFGYDWIRSASFLPIGFGVPVLSVTNPNCREPVRNRHYRVRPLGQSILEFREIRFAGGNADWPDYDIRFTQGRQARGAVLSLQNMAHLIDDPEHGIYFIGRSQVRTDISHNDYVRAQSACNVYREVIQETSGDQVPAVNLYRRQRARCRKRRKYCPIK